MTGRIRDVKNHPYFGYEEDGKVIAYCYAHPWRTRAAHLHTLETTFYLDHSVKHHGIDTLIKWDGNLIDGLASIVLNSSYNYNPKG